MNNYRYQVGGTLNIDAPSYVERRADREIYQALKQGEFCYVLSCRQMGKSSLLVKTKHHLQQEGYKCATIDLTNIGCENITPQQWYKGLIGDLWLGFKLVNKLNLKSWWQEHNDISLVQRLSRFISDILLAQFPNEHFFIFIDEIDSIKSLDFSVDDFFSLIRFCYNQRAINPEYNRITFAIFGVATPNNLILYKKHNTPFNIGKAIELEGFTFDESQPLAKGLETTGNNPNSILREVLFWTKGQPFLTQKLCHLLVNSLQNNIDNKLKFIPGNETYLVENLVRSYIIDKWESQDEPEHLRTIRDRILRNEQFAGSLLGIYRQLLQGMEVPTDDSREQVELLLSGLVCRKEGRLTVRSPIYQEVFNLEWVEKQLANLRPYSQAFDIWLASNQEDTSRLLRGQALIDAKNWANGKSLSNLDYLFLAASEELEHQEIQQSLEAERAKEIEARLKEQQKRQAQQKKSTKIVTFLLVGMTIKFVISLAWGFSLLRQINSLETQVKCIPINHPGTAKIVKSDLPGC
ncbi:WD-40 repeat-containing protein [Calothrix sp. NIES-2100]|uniref:AAA-like domain-containing protein n=1 Tax=Calothrix sp. NIES-2100 TaxID=1954172 RepID=UPI000B5E4618|nr:WD-40 repeat-containing protein [Calothrix sp. NIES-2100]